MTVGWERISGRRAVHEMGDGTFTANTSVTVATGATTVREMLLDEQGRAGLFPDMEPELRPRPTSKNVRIRFGTSTAEIAIASKPTAASP